MIASLYPILLVAHSDWRWAILLAALLTLLAAIRGLSGTRSAAAATRKVAAACTSTLDLQSLGGLPWFHPPFRPS